MKPRILFIVFLGLIVSMGCEKKAEENSQSLEVSKQSVQTGSRSSESAKKTKTKKAKVNIPDQPVSGKVRGKPFTPENIKYDGHGEVKFWTGDDFFPEKKVSIHTGILFGEPIAGKSFDIYPDDEKDSFRYIIIETEEKGSKDFKDGYRLWLDFSEAVEYIITGRIYLEVPGEETKLAGLFQLEEPDKNPARNPGKRHLPYMYGQIGFSSLKGKTLSAAYAAAGNDGKVYGNFAGITIPEQGCSGSYVTSSTYAPRNTTVWCDKEGDVHYRHVRLVPGVYLFGIKWEGNIVAHRWVRVDEKSTLSWNPVIDLSRCGSLLVEISDLKESDWVSLLPLDESGGLPGEIDAKKFWEMSFKIQDRPETSSDSVLFHYLPQGQYMIYYKEQLKKAKVVSGEQAKVEIR